MISDENRVRILNFLQWNDRNGCYTDENYDIENVQPLTYEEVIDYAKQNNFYYRTIKKLQLLLQESSPNNSFYRGLI